MKKLLNFMLAAALICGASVFTSCSKNDNPVNPADNLAENIIGKWIVAEKGGQPVLTNEKAVYTFVSTTRAYISASFNTNPVIGAHWLDKIEVAVGIDGNKMTLTYQTEDHTTTVEELTVTAINGSEFTANRKITVTAGSDVVFSVEDVVRLVKQTADYTADILGLWECKGLKGGETFNDANGRLEFFEDGTYNYYRKNDAGEWEAVTTREFQDYFVDGTLLATRWKNVDEDELREWWEIAYLKGDKMQWKALRQNEDGSTFEQTMNWEKVE